MSEDLPELFARALELDDAGRRALVDEVGGRDRGLAAELAHLLASSGETGSPLDRAPWRPDNDLEALDPPLPDRVGPYRIVRELGRGGMGRVFLAEEETEDFRRAVALKVIDRPAGGEEAVRRFRAAFLTSVELHLRSDVPVGCALSGGLDSSAIVCAMAAMSMRWPVGNT